MKTDPRYNWASTGPGGCDSHCIEHPCGYCAKEAGTYREMKTVLAHGVFDVLHYGHLKYLEEAKKYGDRLIVSITADKYVNKGPGRPYFTGSQRAGMLRALAVVDEVYISNSPTAIDAIGLFKPDYYVKGQDYKNPAQDVTGEILNEKAAVESYGGQLVFTDTETFSSSTLINRFFQGWSEAQKTQIERINSLGGFECCKRAIEKLQNLKVCVVGETIIDVYRFVVPEAISSKSPSISARMQNEETYYGGAAAIYNHLRSFCNVMPCPTLTKSNVFPSKIRYIDKDRGQRIFEVTEIWEDEWNQECVPYFLERSDFDCLVVADFGHGLFEGPTLEYMNGAKGYIGLNVQTNSSNYGYNVYTKHSRFDYLCLDTREARLATHDRFSKPLDIANKIYCDTRKTVSITLGSNGSVLFGPGEYHSPAFSDVVIDATGAGDAYFAITTVLLSSGCKPELIPFIGNVFAGLKTKIIGNKEAVSKASLLKAIESILK